MLLNDAPCNAITCVCFVQKNWSQEADIAWRVLHATGKKMEHLFDCVQVEEVEDTRRECCRRLDAKLGAVDSIQCFLSKHGAALCLVLPSGRDTTSSALDQALDPKRTLALDTLLGMDKHRTLMTTSVTEPRWRDAAQDVFGADGDALLTAV